MEMLLVIVVALVAVPILVAISRSKASRSVTPDEGAGDTAQPVPQRLQPTDKQLDFIEDLEADIAYLNEERDDPVRLPAAPRRPNRAEASDYIDALLAVRERLETDEAATFESQEPTRYRPASIGSRGGVRLEGPDPICTDLDDAKRALTARDIPPNRTPCVVSNETGDWKPVWRGDSAEPTGSATRVEDPTDPLSPFVAYNSKHIQDRQVDTLIGLAKGIIADGVVQKEEAEFLHGWLAANHTTIQANPVVDCLLQRVTTMLSDGVLDAEESDELLTRLKEFSGDVPAVGELIKSTGLPCDHPTPEIVFGNRAFCFTGKCASGTRRQCEDAVVQLGGKVAGNVTRSLNYLILGATSRRRGRTRHSVGRSRRRWSTAAVPAVTLPSSAKRTGCAAWRRAVAEFAEPL